MNRRGTTIGWLGILCLIPLATEAAWRERKGVFYNQNERNMDRMLRALDESVSPCKDFHKYSTGSDEGSDWMLKNPFTKALEEQITPKFHYLFERLRTQSHMRGSMEEKVFSLYNSCEAARRENRSSNIFLDVMRPDVNLSWPSYMPEGRKWPKERFRWLVTLARLSRYGLRNCLFHMSLRVDSQDVQSYIYVIERPIDIKLISNIDQLRAWGISYGMGSSLNGLEYEILTILTCKPSFKRLSLQELEAEHGINLIEFFKIALDGKIDPTTTIIVDVAYLKELNQMLNSQDQETVANYLMGFFGLFMASYQNNKNPKYQCVVAVRTSMKAACERLYKKHILGETHELESQVQRVFEAIRKQFSQRLEANRLNLPTSYISNLRKKLDTTNLNIGVLPKMKDHQSWANYLYNELEFNIDDDFATMQLKAMDVLGKSEELFQDKYTSSYDEPMINPGHTIEFGTSRTIFIPYDLLVEPFYATQTHDVFKVSLLGYIIAEQVVKALYPNYANFDNQHYKEFISLLDDKQVYWDRIPDSYARMQVDYFNFWGLHLVLLNIVHDAYFSPASEFSQVQPDFTSKPLKQLFFLNIAQNIVGSKFHWVKHYSAPTIFEEEGFYNPVFNMTTYAEAFHCSIKDYYGVK